MLPESDWNLLEGYLDDELSPGEVQRLDTRLSDEPALAELLDSIKSHRAARIAVFNSISPGQSQADRFAESFLQTMHRRRSAAKFNCGLRIALGVAASVLVGFTVGWLGRGRNVAPQLSAGRAPASVVDSPATAASHAHSDVRLAIHAPKAAEPGVFQVAVLDADGNVIALQKFARQEDARQFAEDLQQFELRRQQVQQSQAMLVSDSF